MKLLVKIYAILLSLSLTGCFKDNGNYEYTDMSPVEWLFNTDQENIASISAREGEMVKFKASDRFKIVREPEGGYSYEWGYNDRVISTQVDFEMPVNEVLDKMGISAANLKPNYMGYFKIIENKTKITYIQRVYYVFSNAMALRDWVIAIEDESGNTKLVPLGRYQFQSGEAFSGRYYTQSKNFVGREIKLEGRFINMHISKSRDVGPLGSLTVMTDKDSYELATASLSLSRMIKEDFSSGVPTGFKLIDRDDIDGGESENSFAAYISEKGEIYLKTTSPNYLGGKILSVPEEVDAKGYQAKSFAHHRFSNPIVPFWDYKNNRLMAINKWSVTIGSGAEQEQYYKGRMVVCKPTVDDQGGVPVWGMPQGTEVYHLSQVGYSSLVASGYSTAMMMIYKDQSGKVYWRNFAVSNVDGSVLDISALRGYDMELNAAEFTKNTIYLTSASIFTYGKDISSTLYYTNGKTLKWIKRVYSNGWYPYDYSSTQGEFKTFPSNITFLTYDPYAPDNLFVGCENGDVYIYQLEVYPELRLLTHDRKTPINVGGKVLSAKTICDLGGSDDYY